MLVDSQNTEVLIVGAGPTGLLLAVELAAYGIPLRIIDKNEQPSIKSKALVVQVRSLEIFERIGVIDEALRRGRRLRGLGIQTSGATLDVDFEEIKSPFPFPLILEQSETEAILNQKLESYGVHVERKAELVGLQQSDVGISATLNRSDGSREELRARFLVGCDGAHSAVRHLLDLPFEGKSYLQQFILADIGMDWPLGNEKLRIFVTRRGFMAVAPLPDENFFRLITTEADLSLDHDPTIAELQNLADQLLPVKTRILPGPWTARFKISCRKVRQFAKGNVFLAGDAAHIHSPAGGLGMNTGLQDAYNLAWKIALVCHGHAGKRLLDSYEAEREPVAKKLLRTTDRIFFAIGGGVRHPVMRFAQAYLLPIVFGFGPIRRVILRLLSQLGIHYRNSPIVLTSSYENEFFKTGYRLPDLELQRATDRNAISLWEIVRARKHHVLFLGNVHPINFTTDIPHEVHHLLWTGQSIIVIVRPDGHVGACFPGEQTEMLKRYFATISET